MAIFKPSHIIGAISGSINGATFKLTRNGPVIAKRPLLRRRKTTTQHASHSRWNNLSLEWQTLEREQRHAWSSFAQHLPRMNAFGIPRILTGFQTYIAHNTPAYFAGLSLIPDPPEHTQLPPPTSLSSSFETLTDYELGANISGPLDPVYLITEGTNTSRLFTFPGPKKLPTFDQWHFTRWKLIKITSFPLGHANEDVTTEWKALLGDVRIFQEFGFRMSIWHPNALRSPRATQAGAAAL